MKKRRLILLCAFLGIGCLSAYWFSCHSDEPIYSGKPLSYWFKLKLSKGSVEADKILGTVGVEAVPYLRTVLRKEDSLFTKTRNAAWRKFTSSQFVPGTVRQRLGLPVSAARARAEAAQILQRLGPAAGAALPELAASLNHPERAIRFTAFEAVAAIGPEHVGVVPALIETLRHPDPVMRMRSATTLGELKPPSPAVVSALTAALHDPDFTVERAVVQALANAGPAATGAVPGLTTMLKQPDEGVRLIAADALWRISPEQANGIVALLTNMVTTTDTKLTPAPTGQPGRDASEIRMAAVDVLGEMGPLAKEAAPVVRNLLPRGGDDLRFRAANALRRIEPARAAELVPLFVDLLTSTNNLYHPEVIEALGEIGPPAAEAVPTLTQLLNDEDEGTRLTSAMALWQIDPLKANRVVPVLVQLLARDIEAGLSGSDALDVLSEMATAAKDFAPEIRKLLGHDMDKELRKAAGEALEKIEPTPAGRVSGSRW